VDLIVVVLGILVVLALVGSIAVSPLLWIVVVILALFAVLGRGRCGEGDGLPAGSCGSRRRSLLRPPACSLSIYMYWPDSWSLGRRVWATTR